MKIYLAPMEGITGYVYRNALFSCFDHIDRYYTPFVVSTFTKKLKTRERTDVLPQNNAGIPLIPQILSNNAEEFLETARFMAKCGYTEVNLNLGCPVRTVTAKRKGSGFLAYPDELDAFLEKICRGAEDISVQQADEDTAPLRISIKTRLGIQEPGEFKHLLEIYNRYPLAELIIHARTQKELYNGRPHLELCQAIAENCRLPLCWNGNIRTLADYERILPLLKGYSAVMIGRGLIADPGLARQIRTGVPTSKEDLLHFHDVLYKGYQAQYMNFRGDRPGETVLVNRMKEVWNHMGTMLRDEGRYMKNIHKARNKVEYEAAVRMLFANCPLTGTYDGLRPDTHAADLNA